MEDTLKSAENKLKAVWPQWEITDRIGKGSSGTVFRIERELFKEKEIAALKIVSIPQDSSEIEELRSDGYDDDSITARYESYLQSIILEYRYMAELKGCPNIVYVSDVAPLPHDDGIGWDVLIRMELLTPLPDTSIAKYSFSDSEVLRIATDLCRALAACEEKNILHRDIKPQNVFLAEDGTAKLGDFGIAKVAESTTGGTKTGTYRYMAPEVYNNEPYGHKADQYSLGLVLYWMLNERRGPFVPLPPTVLRVKDEENARAWRMNGEPLPPPKHGDSRLKKIVLKACSYDPEDRYHSAAEMLRELEDLQFGRSSPQNEVPPPNTGTNTASAAGSRENKEKPKENKKPVSGTGGLRGKLKKLFEAPQSLGSRRDAAADKAVNTANEADQEESEEDELTVGKYHVPKKPKPKKTSGEKTPLWVRILIAVIFLIVISIYRQIYGF